MPATFKKLLLICSEFPPNVGGIGNHAYNLAKALSNEGFEVTVLTNILHEKDEDVKAFAAKENFTIHYTKRSSFGIKTYFSRIVSGIRLAKNADKVILSSKFSLWQAILIRRFFAKKELIAVVHGTELDLKAAIPRKLTFYSLNKCNKIISVSTYTQQFLPHSLSSTIQKFIIHNGINLDEFQINEAAKLAGTPALITVGNITERKGQENVINALPAIAAKFPAVQYHIVGKPTSKEKIADAARNLKVENRVTFYGAISRNDLLQKLEGATIKLMLSNHTSDGDFEGFGIAVLEANAFGIPAIGSKSSGIADAIEHNKTGLLVDQHNTTEVAEAVATIMANYSSFSANARHWAVQHDWKMIVKEYVTALNA